MGRESLTGTDTRSWEEAKGYMRAIFGTPPSYTIREKIDLLRSTRKREKEDIFDYLIRVACVVGLIQLDRVPKSIGETRTLDNVWTRILFLIGLDEDEQDNLLTESSGTKM